LVELLNSPQLVRFQTVGVAVKASHSAIDETVRLAEKL
jgi:hypothetical protein